MTEFRVDGGMVANSALMQFQADILNLPVIRPVVAEMTAIGAAYAAGLAVNYWTGINELRTNWQEGQRWAPKMPAEQRERLLRNWKKAISKSLD